MRDNSLGDTFACSGFHLNDDKMEYIKSETVTERKKMVRLKDQEITQKFCSSMSWF